MPWIEVDEPYAKPPRVKATVPSGPWSGPLDVDRGWAELAGVEVTGRSGPDLAGCSELSVVDSVITGVPLVGEGDRLAVEIRASVLDGCDLSRARLTSLRNVRAVGCKLIGTDLAGAAVADVEFERCVFRYANLRMARLSRVRFVDCSLEDVDCYELVAEDVEFPGTSLDKVNVDRMQATRVDLRTASEVGLSAVGRLAGCLVSEHQLTALAYTLALAAGADIERPPQF